MNIVLFKKKVLHLVLLATCLMTNFVVLLHMTNTVVPPIISCVKPVSEIEQRLQSVPQPRQ